MISFLAKSLGAVALSASLMASAGPATAQAPTMLGCTGPFAKDAAEAALIAAFGAANVKREDIDVGEGSTEPGTIVFPDDEKRRIEVLWHDNEKRRRPSAIIVRDPSSWRVAVPGEPAVTIGTGTELAAVEAANGKPFQLYGFGWDMGGSAGDWKGGRLAKLEGGCYLSLQFGPDPKAKEAAVDKASGDKPFGSGSAAMKAVKPRVEKISIGWPE